MTGTLYVPTGTHFFRCPPFQNLGLEVIPLNRKGGGTDTVQNQGSTNLIFAYADFCTLKIMCA